MHAASLQQRTVGARVRHVLAGVRVLAYLGNSSVLNDRYFNGASDVLTIWCGYDGPGGIEITSPRLIGTISPATRSEPLPSSTMKTSSCA
jgi:hypothetical protein